MVRSAVRRPWWYSTVVIGPSPEGCGGEEDVGLGEAGGGEFGVDVTDGGDDAVAGDGAGGGYA